MEEQAPGGIEEFQKVSDRMLLYYVMCSLRSSTASKYIYEPFSIVENDSSRALFCMLPVSMA